MSDETKHTPTPWRFQKHGPEFPNYGHIYGEYGRDESGIMNIRTICGMYRHGPEAEIEANVTFIIEAVNAHERLKRQNASLLAACEAAKQELYDMLHSHGNPSDKSNIESGAVVYRQLDAAIAKAKG